MYEKSKPSQSILSYIYRLYNHTSNVLHDYFQIICVSKSLLSFTDSLALLFGMIVQRSAEEYVDGSDKISADFSFACDEACNSSPRFHSVRRGKDSTTPLNWKPTNSQLNDKDSRDNVDDTGRSAFNMTLTPVMASADQLSNSQDGNTSLKRSAMTPSALDSLRRMEAMQFREEYNPTRKPYDQVSPALTWKDWKGQYTT